MPQPRPRPDSLRSATNLAGVLAAVGPRDGVACLDLGPHTSLLTWGDGPALRVAEGWPARLRQMLAEAPHPAGGVVGWLGYEAGRAVERMPAPRVADNPPVCLWGVDGAMHLDRRLGHWTIHGSTAFVEEARDVLERAHPVPPPSPGVGVLSPPADGAVRYQARVRAALDAIARGELYQVNLSWRFTSACSNGLATWLRLRHHNPAWRGAYLRKDGVEIVSNSPERYLSVAPRREASRTVRSVPIKGTTRVEGGLAARRALLRSPKERAELTMIVDLVRNDLGRVAVPGSVCPEPRTLRRCGDLVHAEQGVTATLRPGCDAVDAIAASFPPGSVTGAPKVRAMEWIGSLESHPRGPYTGCFGWLGANGAAELAVAIRTAVVQAGQAECCVGAGIVADSDPVREWDETLSKGRALARHLQGRGDA